MMLLLLFFLALFSIGFVVGKERNFIKQPLVDRKLCNNDPNHKWQQKCYNSQYNAEVSCDSRVIAPENCTQVILKENELSLSTLNDIGQFVDYDSSVRRISIEVSVGVKDTTIWDDIVDGFLIPRPMWSAVIEPFTVSTTPLKYVFERYNQLWDPYYESLISRQFLTSEKCAQSRIVIGSSTCTHPGYSDIRKIYFREAVRLPAVFATYVGHKPPAFDGHATTGFISDADCPLEHKNRWTCAFLPMTNCTLPDAAHKGEPKSMEMYTNATANGTRIHSVLNKNFRDDLVKLDSKLHDYSKQIEFIGKRLPHFVYTSPFSHAANMFKFHGPEDSQVEDFLHMEFLFRKTAFYRRKVAEMFSDFRLKYGLGDRVRTEERRFVGVHIRRGDRVIEGVNTTEMCQNIIMGRIEGRRRECNYADGKVALCPHNGDIYGCENPGEHGIGEITLDGVVKEAELLIGPSIRNMIIFTEDLDWVNKEIERIQNKDWKFYIMDLPKASMSKQIYVDSRKHQEREFSIRGSGTLSGVYFHATIDLAQECDAFIGHFNSGVAMTLTGAMCNHHAGMEGVCPPVYNLKLGT